MRVSGAVKRTISTSDRGPVAAADHADDDDGDQRPRQRQHEIDPAHDRRIDEAAEIAREQAEERRDRESADGDDDRTDQGRPRAEDHARQDVAAEEVGAGNELGRGRRIADGEPLGEGRIGRDHFAEYGADDDHRDDEARQ